MANHSCVLLIVSPNLCVDRIVVVSRFAAGRVHRAPPGQVVAGGKGLNVARAAASLGARSRVAGLVGGTAGSVILRSAAAAGISLDAVRMTAESRTCTIIVDPSAGETVINEEGPQVPPAAVRALAARIRRRLARARVLVLAGSLPPGLPSDFYARTIRASRGVTIILDASGAALRRGLAARPDVVKVNREELQTIAGGSLTSLARVLAAARRLQRAGVRSVVVTLGEDGALAGSVDGWWQVLPPRVRRASAVGAGDSFTAGLAVGVLRGDSFLNAARLGVAAAAADVTTLRPGDVNGALVRRILPRVRVRAV